MAVTARLAASTRLIRALSARAGPLRARASVGSAVRGEHIAAPTISVELDQHPYVSPSLTQGSGRTFFLETYGCQMNVSDSEVVRAVLAESGFSPSVSLDAADVVLINTCAIREGAEQRVWNRLREVNALTGRKLHMKSKRRSSSDAKRAAPMVGLLGCMAERLKGRLLEEERLVDIVCGPDAYRQLPRLLSQASSDQAAIDVRLSLEETYADVSPVRVADGGVSAFVSIMRGCNNMCSYCIVPFTRGRERSRPSASIAAEVSELADRGYKEVTLLGQNVNSYAVDADCDGESTLVPPLRDGFRSMVPPAKGRLRFADLIHSLALEHPEMRFRFTSPHPKDFPDKLLRVVKETPNICEALHIPAQSGSSAVLESMRRGYSREAYLELIAQVRQVLPKASISSDFISGFCGETEKDHQETLSLLRTVRFEKAYMFAYSLREKTHAHRQLADDVPEAVKQRRLREVIAAFNEGARASNDAEVGSYHLLLVDGESKKSAAELVGRSDSNKRVVFGNQRVRSSLTNPDASEVALHAGDFVAVHVTESLSANTLRAIPLARTSIAQFAKWLKHGG